ncbi:MAG: tRNA pseudouridine(13) synthase TruD [Promethearchaeota archaeon]
MTEPSVFSSKREIGLMGYITPQPGIGGRIKQLIEDFIVREITPDGKILPINISQEIEQSNSLNGEYTEFNIVKKDWDTHRLIHKLSRRLRVSRKRISFAGTKDRRALTVQRMSVWKIPPSKLLELRIKDVKILNPSYAKTPISLGDLWGNNFTIIIRDISESTVKIEQICDLFLENIQEIGGLVNFFGHQRFGSLRPITHLVGRSFIQGDFKKASEIFLTATSPLESKEVTIARKELAETEDYRNAVKKFPKGYKPELAMINHLLKHPNDFINAFRKISKELRLMFVHAIQSYLFNKFLSLRVEKGLLLKPIEGDIVQTANGSVHLFKENRNEEESVLVAPLIGYELPLFPSGIVGDLFDELLNEEEIKPSMFHIKSYPEASSKGGYRPVITPVNDFQVLNINDDPFNENKKMLTITFSLRKGSYATILLRELMKTDLITPIYSA